MTASTTPRRSGTVSQTRYEKVGKGHLKIISRYVDGVCFAEVFTFASLAEVLDLPMGTLEGRYQRGRLYRWATQVPTGESRPVRAFPLAMLADVVRVIETPGARVESRGDDEFVTDRGGRRPFARGPLAIETIADQKWISVQAMAEYFGLSITSVRQKLATSGLSRFMRDVRDNRNYLQGGRPRKMLPAKHEEQLKQAFDTGAMFHSELDQVLSRARISEPPPFNPETALQALQALRPAKPHLALVPPAGKGGDVDFDAAMAEINRIVMPPAKPLKAGDIGAGVPVEESRFAEQLRSGHQTTEPQDDYADVRSGMLAMLRMERYSDEAMREARVMLADQAVPQGVIDEIMLVAESARASAERSSGDESA